MTSTATSYVQPIRQERRLYLPVDFIKGELIDFDPSLLLSNGILEFEEVTNMNTGVVNRKVIAKYKGLTFIVFIEGKAFMHGSLHKFWNDGHHNHDQFTEIKFQKMLEVLQDELCIYPHNIRIQQLEFGLNIAPPVDSNDILQCCIRHKNKEFNVDRNTSKFFKQVEHNKYLLKIYNKAIQYGLQYENLRIEMKYMNWSQFRQLGIKTFQDFIDYNGEIFVTDLLAQWHSVYFYDPTIKTDKYIQYRDPVYWSDLQKKSSRTTIKKHKDRLDRIGHEEGNGLKNEIRRLLIENLNSLQGGNEL
jgi:hypothetical protein